jgi:hypothetical protein
MTVFGWDASHYDGLLTPSILARAKGEGIGFFTHKIAEGLGDTEGTNDDTALAAARSAGIEFLGGYLVPRSGPSVSAQVDRWLVLADAGEGWWRSYPGWFWQVDLERWPYDDVRASVGVEAAQLLHDRTGKWTILYASHGQYRESLGAWGGPLWNAHYTSRVADRFDQMYPGDIWRPALDANTAGGWAAYSGREPTFLQFTDRATIAGLTTCDANAYRGTTEQLRALISGTTTSSRGDDDMQIYGEVPAGVAFQADAASNWAAKDAAGVLGTAHALPVPIPSVGRGAGDWGDAWLYLAAVAKITLRVGFIREGGAPPVWSDFTLDLGTSSGPVAIPAGTTQLLIGRKATAGQPDDVPARWHVQYKPKG